MILNFLIGLLTFNLVLLGGLWFYWLGLIIQGKVF